MEYHYDTMIEVRTVPLLTTMTEWLKFGAVPLGMGYHRDTMIDVWAIPVLITMTEVWHSPSQNEISQRHNDCCVNYNDWMTEV